MKKELTIFAHKIIKNSRFWVSWDLRKVKMKVRVASDEILQSKAITKFQKGSNTPHDSKDIQVLVVGFWKWHTVDFDIIKRDEAC